MEKDAEEIRDDIEKIAPIINPREDFATFSGGIEPNRDLCLKLIKFYELSCDTNLVSSDNGIYIFKARVWNKKTEQEGTSHGSCDIKEKSHGGRNARVHHDALGTAETRAIKRAIEGVAGLAIINQLIKKFFGGFEVPQVKNGTDPQRKQILDEMAVVMQDAVFTDADRALARDAVKKTGTKDLPKVLELYTKERETRTKEMGEEEIY